MRTMTNRRTIAATAITGLLAVGLIVPALAQDDGNGTGDTSATESVEDPRAARHAAFAAALAEELDLDVDTVSDALATVHEAMRAERGPGGRGPGGHGPGGGPGHGGHGHHGGPGGADRTGTGTTSAPGATDGTPPTGATA
jgi:hypothetical protein